MPERSRHLAAHLTILELIQIEASGSKLLPQYLGKGFRWRVLFLTFRARVIEGHFLFVVDLLVIFG